MRNPDTRRAEALAEFGVTTTPDTGCECGASALVSLETHINEWVVVCPKCKKAGRHDDLPTALELWRACNA